MIRKDAVISGYRAVDGVIQIGPVTLGRDVFVGEMTVLDIATSMGDGAQLGHSSSLHSGQSVPAGAHWHGSPAEPTTVDYCTVRSTRLSFLRRFLLPLLQLLFMLAVTLPLALGGAGARVPAGPAAGRADRPGARRHRHLGLLPRRAAGVDRAVLRRCCCSGLLVGDHRAAAAARARQARPRVPALRHPLLGPPPHRADDQQPLLRAAVRRQLAHRRLPAQHRLQAGQGRADRVELRHGGAARQPVPQPGRHAARWWPTGCRSSTPTTRPATSASPGSRSGRTTSSATGSPTPRRAAPGTTACSPPRSWSRWTGQVREGVGLLGSPSFEIPRTVDRDHQLDVTDPAEVRRLLRRQEPAQRC